MVEQFFRETTGLSEYPPDPVAQTAIVPLYADRILFANQSMSSANAVSKLSPSSLARVS
jgi:hypothetical protein